MRKLVFLLFAIIWLDKAVAQNLAVIDQELASAYRSIENASDKHDDIAVQKANQAFITKLKAATVGNVATLKHPFNLLKAAHVNVVSSPDGLFRIYSWDSLTGGTMHFFYNLFQYQSSGKVFTLVVLPEEGDAGTEYNKAYQVSAGGSKTVYLVTIKGIGSSRDISEGIKSFVIDNGKVTDEKIFKTGSGLKSRIVYSYDFFSVVDWKERPEPRYDEKTQTIYLPLVDANNKMTHRFIHYKFNGQYFVKVK